ncbi:MAG: RND family transporter [Deltaproteobacteria bacterium]|nr:RND family transporter [Deltaproteobacteria bacterium]
MSTEGDDDREFLTWLDDAFATIAGWSFDHRWAVVGVAIALVLGCIQLASGVRQDNSYEAYFDPDDTSARTYERYREDFGSDEVAYILYEAPDFEYGPWNLEVMRKLASLTRALQDEVPFVYDVKTLVNAELTQGVADGIEIFELGDDFPRTQEELLLLRDAYLGKPMLVGGIVSEDAKFGAIILEMDRTSTDPPDTIRWDPERGDEVDNLYPQASFLRIEEILTRPEYAGIEFYHSGDVPINAEYNLAFFSESAMLNAVTSLVIGVLLAYFFRSAGAVVAPLVVVQLGVFACLAFIAVVGWSVTMSFGSMPTLLTAIGVAHSVHILSEFGARFGALGDRREAMVQTFYLVGTPCLLTSLTTAAGFGAMSFVPIRSVSEMGVYAAFGVLMAFVLSFTLLAALLSFGRRPHEVLPAKAQSASAKGGERMRAALRAIARFDQRHSVAILAAFGALLVFSLAGMTRLVADSNWLDDYSDEMPVKAATMKVDKEMGGTSGIAYLFDSGVPDGIKEPLVLREIERLEQLGEAYDPAYVRKAYSIVDILKDLNQAFHGGDPVYHEIPESRELVAQYLLLYEMSGGEETEKYVTSDYQRASLEFRLAMGSSQDTADLMEALAAALAENPVQGVKLTPTGIGALWVKMMDYIVTSQVRGFLLAFCAISLLMVAIFRSLRVGAIAMLPNLAPVLLTLGAMGWLGILLDYSKVSIAAVAMGIAVDDTIHLVTRYRHEFRLRGDYVEALTASMQDVGRALVITSIALVCGFLVLTLSILDVTAVKGILLSTTIVTALVADFFLMPALILTFKPFGPESRP